jgi:hypothetical protein
MNDWPVEDWSDQGILRALTRLSRDLPGLGADERRKRLQQLTAEQREVVEGVIERMAAEIARTGSA